MIRRLLQPNLIRRAVAIAIGGGRYASTGFSRASGGLWTPLDLFAGGKKGAWYDPSDLSTMWQDSAGTTPVTADGQPVGKILDKSGNGNHATQPVAGKRPTYHTAGGTHWLYFDGVDDSLYTASINLNSTSKISVFAGTANSKTLSTGTLLEFSANYLNNVGGFAMLTPSLATSHISFGSHGTAAAGEKETQEAPVGLTRPRVITCAQNFATTDDYGCDYIRANQIPIGNLVGAGNTNVGAGPLGTFPAYIGARNNGANASGGNSLWGRVYSLIFVGEMYDQATLVQAEEWIDAKMVAIYMPIWSRYYNVDPALGANATFTRAGTAYVQDHLSIYNLAAANEARMEGARRIENFIAGTSENLVNPINWSSFGGGNVIDATTVDCLDAGQLTVRNANWRNINPIEYSLNGYKFTVSFDAARITGTGNVAINIGGNGGLSGYVTLTNSVRRYSITGIHGYAIMGVDFFFNALGTYHLSNIHADYIPVGSPEAPSEYVSVGVLSAPYHGAGVDGVKYFDYANGNTVDANGVVTEAQGAAIDPATMYLLMESAATNYILYSCNVRDRFNVLSSHLTMPDARTYTILGAGSYAIAEASIPADKISIGDTVVGSILFHPDSTCTGIVGVRMGGNNFEKTTTVDMSLLTEPTWVKLEHTWTVNGTYLFFGIENRPGDCPGANASSGTIVTDWTQVESDARTSPILTTTAAVTRAADALAYSGVPADNEALFTNKLGVETKPNDWNGTVPVPGTYRSIEVYTPGDRP